MDAGVLPPEVDASLDDVDSPPFEGEGVFEPLDELDARASFFAQPDPLNTIAGGERSFRIGPPQNSHAFGPWAWTPCITSTVRWQLVQM